MCKGIAVRIFFLLCLLQTTFAGHKNEMPALVSHYNDTLVELQHPPTEKAITLKPYGYVSYEAIYDTYRSLDTRDGELYLFPRKPVFDALGNDINKRSKFNMLSVQSRFGVNISGPDALGARISARLEADFFGTHQDYVRLLRMRLAFISMKWAKTELIMGNTFHPAFVLDCFPGTISFAAAVPFHPLNRSPQFRVKHDFTPDVSASVSFLVHGYHASAGPNDAQRNTGRPESVLQLRWGNTRNVMMGATAGYKFLSPRDITDGGMATTKTVGAFHAQAFSRIRTTPFTLKLEGLYGENLSHFVMIGGYGAKGTDTAENPFDWSSDYDYANLRTLSLWADLQSNNKLLQWGLFAGYTENLGSKDPYLRIAQLARYDDLHYLFRISPRLVYYAGNLSFGLECSYYSAVYTETYDIYRKPMTSMDSATNWHIILMAKYDF